MNELATVIGALYVAVGVVSVGLTRHGLRSPNKPGSTGFTISTVGVAAWAISSGINIFFQGFDISLGAYYALLAGTNVVGVGWYLLAVEVTDRRPVTSRLVSGLLVCAALIQVTVWTNPWHHLVLLPSTTIVDGIFTPAYGSVYWVVVGFGYVLSVVGTGFLAIEAYRTRGARRRQTAALAAGVFPPLIASGVSIFDVMGNPYDLTPFGFLFMELVFFWALYRARFLDLTPVARQTVLEEMQDMVVTLDDDDRIVDYNSAAGDLFDITDDDVGTPAIDLFAPYDNLVNMMNAAEDETALTVTDGGQVRHLSVTVTSVESAASPANGRVVVLQDVTRLERRRRKINLMRQVFSRVLRHNTRNELQVVRVQNEVLVDELTGRHREMARRALESANALASTSSKARTAEQVIDQTQSPRSLDLAAVLDDIVDQYRAQFPAVEFTLDAPGQHVVETNPSVEFALENLVENAAEHNEAAEPSVSVMLTPDADATTVTVSDNGPGIPEQELTVIEQGEETDLTHGSGMGLWVIDWIIDSTVATIDFDVSDRGTDVTIRIPAVDETRPESS